MGAGQVRAKQTGSAVVRVSTELGAHEERANSRHGDRDPVLLHRVLASQGGRGALSNAQGDGGRGGHLSPSKEVRAQSF